MIEDGNLQGNVELGKQISTVAYTKNENYVNLKKKEYRIFKNSSALGCRENSADGNDEVFSASRSNKEEMGSTPHTFSRFYELLVLYKKTRNFPETNFLSL